ncbi:hypothetical protein SteCoe_31854 [Stentor coeruleus]|uniref:Uncharacterized protein n=1 Tax=Stentor coeruleus TaxID=5963 RepID=A0A1R2B0B1_9CILI|nr:hypothetical protein SteCoe_31854 [Stentor coeruleus]
MSEFIKPKLASTEKLRKKYYTSKPVTPKHLLEMSYIVKNSSSFLRETTQFSDIQGIINRKRPNTASYKRKNKIITSPVPEFAKDYILSCMDSKKTTSKSMLSTQAKSKDRLSQTCLIQNENTSQIVFGSEKKDKRRYSKRINIEKEPTLNKILRLYKPQILNFKDKSKIRIFATISIEARKSKEKMIKNMKRLNKLELKKSKEKCESKTVEVETPKEVIHNYDKPAATYGEKLWRLNEVSILLI